LEATKEIIQYQHKNNINIPVIALTANATKSDKDKCLQAGMSSFVAKPFSNEILLTSIQQTLEGETSNNNDSRVGLNSTISSLNLSILDNLKIAMEDDFEELIHAYIKSSQSNIDELCAAFEKQDNKTMQRMAHSLKSASANLGASLLSTQAEILEKDCRDNSSIPDSQLLTIKDEFEKVTKLLENYSNSNQ
jgi:two-component system, sensor histidine kinase and response regulator